MKYKLFNIIALFLLFILSILLGILMYKTEIYPLAVLYLFIFLLAILLGDKDSKE